MDTKKNTVLHCNHYYFLSPFKQTLKSLKNVYEFLNIVIKCIRGRGYKCDCGDYADLVPDCEAETFLGFTCTPEARIEGFGLAEQHLLESGDCQRYFLCNESRPRLYTYGTGYAFNEQLNACDDVWPLF